VGGKIFTGEGRLPDGGTSPCVEPANGTEIGGWARTSLADLERSAAFGA